MNDTSSKKSAHDSIDPLGEIRRRAEQLWQERGKPAGTSWEDFKAEAEASLLGGTSDGIPSGRTRITAGAVEPSPEILALREQLQDPFLAAVAQSMTALFDSHEAFCFAQLCKAHTFTLRATEGHISPSDSDVAKLLAIFARDYPSELLTRERVQTPAQIPLEHRVAFWHGEIARWRHEDRPLTFTDRNTMQRLHEALQRGEAFADISLI